MSAYLVSDKHIKTMAINHHRDAHGIDLDAINETARILHDANCDSLRARYNDDSFDPAPVVAIADINAALAVAPVALIKACYCYDYQSCEFEGWEASEACKISSSIVHDATTGLPGYEDAPWGM